MMISKWNHSDQIYREFLVLSSINSISPIISTGITIRLSSAQSFPMVVFGISPRNRIPPNDVDNISSQYGTDRERDHTWAERAAVHWSATESCIFPARRANRPRPRSLNTRTRRTPYFRSTARSCSGGSYGWYALRSRQWAVRLLWTSPTMNKTERAFPRARNGKLLSCTCKQINAW